MVTTVTSIRLPEDLYERIEALAKATGRAKNYLLMEAISRYVEEEAWQLAAIEKGIQSSETEPTITQDDLLSDLLQRGLVTEESLAAASEHLTTL